MGYGVTRGRRRWTPFLAAFSAPDKKETRKSDAQEERANTWFRHRCTANAEIQGGTLILKVVTGCVAVIEHVSGINVPAKNDAAVY